jgi:hypothetical protein
VTIDSAGLVTDHDRLPCKEWRIACEGGSDTEGYGCAIGNTQYDDAHWYLGSMMDHPLAWCPFCGLPVKGPK